MSQRYKVFQQRPDGTTYQPENPVIVCSPLETLKAKARIVLTWAQMASCDPEYVPVSTGFRTIDFSKAVKAKHVEFGEIRFISISAGEKLILVPEVNVEQSKIGDI